MLGILAAYAAVTGILYAFAYGSRRRIAGTPVLVPSQSQAGERLKGRRTSDLARILARERASSPVPTVHGSNQSLSNSC